jgi:hypothetical protein
MDHDDKNKFENDIIDRRLTWLGTFEGLLFVADHYGDHPYLIPLAGLVIALSIDQGIRESNRQLTKHDGQVKGFAQYFMPGTIIPKTIAVAWVVLFLENFHGRCQLAGGATIPRMGRDWWGIGASTLAQWVGALGTILAVIVALSKDRILEWLHKPEFEVTCANKIPWTVKVWTTVWPWKRAPEPRRPWMGDCYFVRVKIVNTGKRRARKVQVSASNLAKRGADSKTFEDMPTLLPLNMKWANSPPDEAVAILDGISSGMSAFCDIVSVCDPGNFNQSRPAPNETVAQLQTEVSISDLGPGTYQLTLRIAAANVAPVERIVEFAHSGVWTPDDNVMRRDNLAASLV